MRVFKIVQPSSITPSQTLVTASPLTLGARAANPDGTAHIRASTPACLLNRAVGHRAGNPAHAAVPSGRSASPSPSSRKSRRRPEIGGPRKTLPPNFPNNFPNFLNLFPYFFSYFSFPSFLNLFPISKPFCTHRPPFAPPQAPPPPVRRRLWSSLLAPPRSKVSKVEGSLHRPLPFPPLAGRGRGREDGGPPPPEPPLPLAGCEPGWKKGAFCPKAPILFPFPD
jgi:hypothetical protein